MFVQDCSLVWHDMELNIWHMIASGKLITEFELILQVKLLRRKNITSCLSLPQPRRTVISFNLILFSRTGREVYLSLDGVESPLLTSEGGFSQLSLAQVSEYIQP